MNEQQQFWKEKYASAYIAKNSVFDFEMGVQGWKQMLQKISGINSFLECG